MAESPKLIALRKYLATPPDGLDSAGKKKMAEDTIDKILAAMEGGVCPLGDWERRCLAAAIISVRSSKYDEARIRARQALWPDENRRNASVSRFPLRPGMLTVKELQSELAHARARPHRGETAEKPA